MSDAPLYERDFYAWTQAQADGLRRLMDMRVNAAVDLPNLIEEVEDLGKRDLRSLERFLEAIIAHLLKLRDSPLAEPRSHWEDEVAAFRNQAEALLDQSPSLRQKVDLGKIHARAARLARTAARHGVFPSGYEPPSACPYTLAQLLDPDWWPENRHGSGGEG